MSLRPRAADTTALFRVVHGSASPLLRPALPWVAGTVRVQGLVGAAMLTLTGCTDAATEPDSTPATGSAESAAPTSAPTPWSLPLPAIGKPMAAGDVAVVYTADAGVLSLVAVHSHTGKVLWTRPASPASWCPASPSLRLSCGTTGAPSSSRTSGAISTPA